MITRFGWFPSSGLGTRCLKLLLHKAWQAGACKPKVPKLEFGNQPKLTGHQHVFQIRHRAPDGIGQIIPGCLTGWLAGFVGDEDFLSTAPVSFSENNL